MAEEEKKMSKRKCVGWMKAAVNAQDTLSLHTDDELKEIINDCSTLLEAAKQARLSNADAAIAKMEAELEELRQLREEAQQ